MEVVGLDLSLTSTGLASIDDDDMACWHYRPGPARGHDRIELILEEVRAAILGRPDLVVVEGPSFGSAGSSFHQLAGLWWCVTQELWNYGQVYAVVPPSSVKMYGTGAGNAGKDEVVAAVVRRWLTVAVRGNDEADAVLLAAMGARHLGYPVEPAGAMLTPKHLRGMDKVPWPALPASAYSATHPYNDPKDVT